jgi:hypothetical protein
MLLLAANTAATAGHGLSPFFRNFFTAIFAVSQAFASWHTTLVGFQGKIEERFSNGLSPVHIISHRLTTRR